MESIEILLEEYKMINHKIEQFIGNQHQYLNTSFILIGGYLFFLLTGENHEEKYFYFPFLPILTALILGIVGYQYQRTVGLQGYKKYLEERINKIMGEDILVYTEIGMITMVNKNRFTFYNFIMYLLVYILTCVISFNFNTYEPYAFLFVHIGIFIILVICFWPIKRFKNRVYKESLSRYIRGINSNTKIVK